MKTDNCRSCKAQIIWTMTERGRRMPVDAEPSKKGNIMLHPRPDDQAPLAIYLTTEQIAAFDGSLQRHRLFTSHFVTCPEAKKWRKK
jgi:hypothetical protein